MSTISIAKATRFAISAALIPTASLLPVAASAVHASSSWTILSSYSGYPGSTFQVMGYGFMPGEMVTMTFEGMSKMATSNGSGMASAQFMVPWRMAGSYQIQSMASSGNSTAQYYVQGYYPQTEPSSYYVMKGQTMSVMGRNFAPNEPVHLMVNGIMMTEMMADGGGNVTFGSVMAPMNGSTFMVGLHGMWTNMLSERTVTLAQ